MNAKANIWHPWKGKTPGVAKETRQQIRRYLRETLGDVPGKEEYRRMRGLGPLVRRNQ